jgi:hypothetical protein
MEYKWLIDRSGDVYYSVPRMRDHIINDECVAGILSMVYEIMQPHCEIKVFSNNAKYILFEMPMRCDSTDYMINIYVPYSNSDEEYESNTIQFYAKIRERVIKKYLVTLLDINTEIIAEMIKSIFEYEYIKRIIDAADFRTVNRSAAAIKDELSGYWDEPV